MTWSLSFLCSSSGIKISEANTHSLHAIWRGWVVRKNQHRWLPRVCHFPIWQVEQVGLFLVAIDSTTRLEMNLTMSHTVCEGTSFPNLQIMVSKQDVQQFIFCYPRRELGEVKEFGRKRCREEMPPLYLALLKGRVWEQPSQCRGPIVHLGAGQEGVRHWLCIVFSGGASFLMLEELGAYREV